MTFNFNARYALLTYAQCGELDPFEIVNHLAELRGECIVAREAHADGGTHLHAFVDFGRKFRSRRADIFDVDGRHPNVSPTHSTPSAGYDYATKDAELVAGGLERPASSDTVQRNAVWHEITAAGSREEFFQLLLQHDPRTLCTCFAQLTKYADWRYRVDAEQYRHPLGLEECIDSFPELSAWVQESLDECRVGIRKKSLVLHGPSRMGKTLWARKHGQHAYFGGLFSLEECTDSVKYAVFDDINGGIQFFPQYKWWLGHQAQFYATDKYKGKKLIHWGRPAIWVSNDDPREQHGADADWLNANCTFVYVDSPLFSNLN
ncbi:MAG: replication-associated protein [Genomoviridae sp.]|uniref:replication-associated protein n=1 Tax=Genomoviridae sp. TaxID=2202565 RepID=UPI002481F6B1|nr:MAG: replication-associated protein [Genomoviridae sp.]QCW23623.1 MAG: replication-associated protein [Genomoviridae sp.]